jgi:hypothetical protein
MTNDASGRTEVGRRQFVQRAVYGAIAGVAVQSAITLGSSQPMFAQAPSTPEAALQQLLAGNQRFAATGANCSRSSLSAAPPSARTANCQGSGKGELAK